MRSLTLALLLSALSSSLCAQTATVYKTIASDALLENLAVKSGKSITVLSGGSITINSGASITNNGTATGFGGGTIATLTDVTLTSLAGLDLLMYDSGTSKWINVAPATARSYLDLDGTIEGGLSFTGTNGAALNIGDGGTLKSGAFSEYGTDENQLLRWATNANANPVTYAIGATDLGAVKRIASLPIAAGGTNAETANAALNNLLPSQTTHAGEFLWTDGVDTNWGLVDLGSSVQGLLPASSLSTGTVPSDNTITFGPGATSAGLNVGSNNADPATLNNGDLWYESSANALRARINGTTRDLLHSGSSIDSSQITDGTIVNADISGSAAIALSKLAQSGATSNQVISWNGSAWAPATTSTGITIGTTTTSGASANDILISNGSVVQKITPGTGVATALANAVDASGGLLTYSLLSTANTFAATQTMLSARLGEATGAYLRDGKEASGDSNQKGRLSLTTSDAYGIQMSGTASWYTLGYISAGAGYINPYYSGKIDFTSTGAELYGATGLTKIVAGTTAQELQVWNTTAGGGKWASVRHDGSNAVFSASSGGIVIGTGSTAIAKVKHGTATLSSGAATVSDSDVVAGSRIFVNRQSDGGTLGDSFSIDITAGTQFIITSKTADSTASSDTSTVSWIMINP